MGRRFTVRGIDAFGKFGKSYTSLGKSSDYVPDFKVSVDGYLQPAMHAVVLTGAYDNLMSGARGCGPKKDAYGEKLKLFSTALADRGTLNAVLSHLIESEAWGPDGPETLADLYGQALTSNKHDKGRKGHGTLSEMRIGLKLKGDSLALRPLEIDTSKVWLVETAHETYSYEENFSPKRFAVMAANTFMLFKASKLLHETALVLGGKELEEEKVNYILVGQSPREPVSGFSMQYADFEQPVKEYVVKVARDILKDEETGLPNLRGEKGLVVDLAQVYKRMFRLAKSPSKPAIILSELLNSIMEDARKEVRDEMLQEGKKDKAAQVPRADSSFVLDQQCLLAIGVASNLPLGHPTRQLNYTASDQLEYITWRELRAIGTVGGVHNTETLTEHQLVDSGLFSMPHAQHLTPLIKVFGCWKTQARIEQ